MLRVFVATGCQAGLSLTELLVVSATFTVLVALVYATFAYESQAYSRATNQNVSQRDLRVWLARMESEIREAGYNPLETTPSPFTIGAHGASDFQFKLDAGLLLDVLQDGTP